MARPPKLYTRLPGRGTAGFQRSRLWLGPDHLLLVASSTIGERYKRFYFADIQALVIRRKWSFPWASLAWLPLIWIAALAAQNLGSGLAWIVMLASIGVLAACFLAHIFLRASQCQCRIQTAVQTEVLASLHRLRAAQKVFAQLRPLIEAAQSPAPASTAREAA